MHIIINSHSHIVHINHQCTYLHRLECMQCALDTTLYAHSTGRRQGCHLKIKMYYNHRHLNTKYSNHRHWI